MDNFLAIRSKNPSHVSFVYVGNCNKRKVYLCLLNRVHIYVEMAGIGHEYFLAVARKSRDPGSRLALLSSQRSAFQFPTQAKQLACSFARTVK